MNKRRPTQRDVAAAAGVHRATVSLVFRNHPSIPETTKERVKQAAKRIGYHPDPMLAALASYRNQTRPKTFQGVLAWVVNNEPGYDWKSHHAYCQYYDGAQARATELGYNLETFDFQQKEMSKERLASIFRSRNIRGILLCPQPHARMEVNFSWENFSSVTFGHSLAKPQLHMVTSSQARAMVTTMRQIRKAGFQRIGFAFNQDHDERSDHNYLSGYLSEQHIHGVDPLVFSLPSMEHEPRAFARWARKHRLQAIVCGHGVALDTLKKIGMKVPEDIGVAVPSLAQERYNGVRLSGMQEDSLRIGAVAINLVASMIQQGEVGVPTSPQQILVDGTWREGETLGVASSRRKRSRLDAA